MADMTGLTRQTVSKKLKFLAANGWICIAKTGRSNVYIVNPDLVWTAYAEQKKYCHFEASVMLDAADNWEIFNNSKASIKHVERGILQKIEKVFFEDSMHENDNL